jgi:predicted RNase H-like nuclease
VAALDEAVLHALSDGRLDSSLEFRREPGGAKSGTLRIGDPTVELESPEAMNVALARLVELGFRDRTEAPDGSQSGGPTPRITTRVLVAGVDGCREGWVAVSLDPSGDVQVSTHATFEEVLRLRARVIAVDIPIDPDGNGSRPADAATRAFVGGRASSVFPTAPRRALQARTFADANEIARAITGTGVSQQSFALASKILEVDELARQDDRVIEVHPEASFCRLAGGPLAESKHTPRGLERRRALLASAGLTVPDAVHGVREVDLLDAAAAAWTAARYALGDADALPSDHTDRLGAIWS